MCCIRVYRTYVRQSTANFGNLFLPQEQRQRDEDLPDVVEREVEHAALELRIAAEGIEDEDDVLSLYKLACLDEHELNNMIADKLQEIKEKLKNIGLGDILK